VPREIYLKAKTARLFSALRVDGDFYRFRDFDEVSRADAGFKEFFADVIGFHFVVSVSVAYDAHDVSVFHFSYNRHIVR